MRTRIKEVSGIDWYDGAVMNCVWEGPRLRDVLMRGAGVDEVKPGVKRQQQHVQFASYGTKTQEDSWYGGSIPFERAMNPEMDVILAVKVSEPYQAPQAKPFRTVQNIRLAYPSNTADTRN